MRSRATTSCPSTSSRRPRSTVERRLSRPTPSPPTTATRSSRRSGSRSAASPWRPCSRCGSRGGCQPNRWPRRPSTPRRGHSSPPDRRSCARPAMTIEDPPQLTQQPPATRERVIRTLTFWLRPEFVLRVLNRFQKVAGFDRSIALASSALTATIPLALVSSAVATKLGGKGVADRIIDRYELTGGGAEAVKDVFAPPTGTTTSLGVIGVL